MKKSRLPGALCAIAIIVCSNHSIAAEFIPLGDLPGGYFNSVARGISADGSVVVGQSVADSGFEAFRWTISGGMVGLGDFTGGSFVSQAYGVSDDGAVVVGVGRTSTGNTAFRWTTAGGMSGIGAGNPSTAYGVSTDGTVIVGNRNGNDAFRLVEGSDLMGIGDPLGYYGSQALAVSSDGAVVVGVLSSDSGTEASRWVEGGSMVGLGELPGGFFFSTAKGVSADGKVVVGYSNSDSGQEAFRWIEGGSMVGLGDLPGGDFFSVANDVSADGTIIVGQSIGADGREAFRWTSANGMQSVASLLTDAGIDITDWILTEATAVSDDGNIIAGYGFNPDGNTEAWIAHLLLPTTPILYCVGVDIGIFNAPLNAPVTVNKRARVLPFSMTLIDEFGNSLSDADIVPPIIEVDVAPGNTVSAPPPESLESVGKGDDGNQFTFNGTKWGFNLKTKNFSGAGMYTATVVSGDPSSYLVDPTCEGTFYITH